VRIVSWAFVTPIETTTISPFGVMLLVLQTDRLFDGDLVEGIHAHLDVGKIHARLVRLDAGLHVIVEHAFDGDENLHGSIREIA
jgi:hypothetical protein